MAVDIRDIGTLAQFPFEIRELIWKDFSPRQGQETDLSILRTCRQLYEEVSPHIYEKEVLRF